MAKEAVPVMELIFTVIGVFFLLVLSVIVFVVLELIKSLLTRF